MYVQFASLLNRMTINIKKR